MDPSDAASALLAFSASSSVSPSVPPSESSLTRLPAVLIHLVMQHLPLTSLAHLASTCRRLGSEALHPSAGRYVDVACPYTHEVSLSPPAAVDLATVYPFAREEARAEQATYSALGRAHFKVTLLASLWLDDPAPHLAGLSQTQLAAALVTHASRWSHVDALDLSNAEWWSVKDALALLQSPALQRVSSVVSAAGVWLCEAVQTAMCQLSLLSWLDVGETDEGHPVLRLHPSALVRATSLRRISRSQANVPPYMLAGLVVASGVTRLDLQMSSWAAGADKSPTEPLIAFLTLHCRPMLGNLRVLQLTNFNLVTLSRVDRRRFFRAMPRLAFLRTTSFFPNAMLRSLMDTGADALPELRVVRFWQDRSGDSGGGGDLSRPLLRAFLSVFRRVRYCLELCGDGDESAEATREFAQWPRVCTKQDHAAPRITDGLCEECPQDKDRHSRPSVAASAATAPPTLAVEDYSSVDLSAVEASEASGWRAVPVRPGQRPSWYHNRSGMTIYHDPTAVLANQDEIAPAMPTQEESLRTLQSDYDAAVAKYGPWVPPGGN